MLYVALTEEQKKRVENAANVYDAAELMKHFMIANAQDKKNEKFMQAVKKVIAQKERGLITCDELVKAINKYNQIRVA